MALWTQLIVWSLTHNIDQITANNTELARNSAKNIFRMVELTRLWNASHGGVYVPVTARTQPNPYLEIPHRDLESTSGVQLTMVNPAFMTRQLTEMLEARSHVKFHITSLKPLRPQNTADAWETLALQQFENDIDEVYERITSDQQDIFRYMAPLLVKKPCLKCHEAQGYQLGDIRGGISVTLEADRLFGSEGVSIRDETINHVAVYLLVALMLLLFFEKMRLQWIQLRLIEQQQEQVIRDRTHELELLARKDALTGLFNRKALDEQLKSEVDRATRYQHEMILMMLDIDHFKLVNDNYSHLAGDRVLKEIARILLKTIRTTDFAARFGGEEFIVLLPETDIKEAGQLAERLRREIGDLKVEDEEGQSIDITASIGVAMFPEHAQTPRNLIGKADEALYEAKKQGRNRVVLVGAERAFG